MRARLLQTLTAMLVAAGCSTGPASSPSGAPLWKEIRGAPAVKRSTAGMLSVPVDYAPCAPTPGTYGRLACAGANPTLSGKWAAIGGRIAGKAATGADPDALHAAALLDLLAGASGNSLDRSISYLEMIVRIAPSRDRYVDLSAAYLARAGRDGDARSIVAALDAAARAVDIDSTSAAARFNMGLALRELGLFGAAANEFRAVSGRTAEGWRSELPALLASVVIDTIRPRGASTSPDSMEAFARLHANDARNLAWDSLAGWARAVQARDSATAERNLQLAEAAGRGILAEHVDPAISDAVKAIRAASGDRRERLAAAHIAFTGAPRLTAAGNARGAEAEWAKARRLGAESPALVAFATYAAANNRLALSDPVGAERAMRAVLSSPAATRYPALAARAHWGLGVVLLRNHHDAEGLPHIEKSRALYALLGEPEYEAAMTGQLAEVAALAGDARRAFELFAKALDELRPYPMSPWRHNVMLLLAREAGASGFSFAARRIQADDDAASEALRRYSALAESRLSAARAAQDAGDERGIIEAIADGRRLASQVTQSNTRRQLEMELYVEASAAPGQTPAIMLDSAIAYFDSVRIYSKVLRALSARAALAVREGRIAQADSDLSEALEIFSTRREQASTPTARALLIEQGQRVSTALMMLRIARGDAAGAYAARERVREKVKGGTWMANGPVLEWSVVGDTLVSFVIRHGAVSVLTRRVNRAGLRTDIDRLDFALERNAPVSESQTLLESLYETLVTPVEPQIEPQDSALTLIVDGALNRVPFAALRQRRSGSYLIQRHALRFASSFGEAAASPRPLTDAPEALVVGNPPIDRRAFPGLEPLRGAEAEAEAVAASLGHARLLRGSDVDTVRLRKEMASVEIFHFGGHALLDDEQPQRSLLAIGSKGLSATSIASMRLPSLRLVVLSACETGRGLSSTGGGLPGLAESFSAAGAGGVVGSIWKVDDQSTQTLMKAFYPALLKTRDPARALRDAQLSMVHLSPATWAAFKYAGR